MYNDDDFNWNYGIAQAAVGNYKEAEETLLLVMNEKYHQDYCYLSWLCRCYIMNKKTKLAWEQYLKMDTSNDSFSLLQLIANDCYKVGSVPHTPARARRLARDAQGPHHALVVSQPQMGAFFYAAKAFDVLERLDPDPEYWEGKRGACVGVLQQVIAGVEPKDSLRDVLAMLRNTSNPQVEYIVRTIQKWCKQNGVPV